MTFIHIALLMLCHFIADFILQTDKMAIGKSTSMKWLTIHVVTYMVPFSILMIFFAPSVYAYTAFIVVNFILHWITDYITSRVGSYFYQNDQRGMFFKTIGFDQYIHIICLTGTFIYFIL